jgi:hypothetical protein
MLYCGHRGKTEARRKSMRAPAGIFCCRFHQSTSQWPPSPVSSTLPRPATVQEEPPQSPSLYILVSPLQLQLQLQQQAPA